MFNFGPFFALHVYSILTHFPPYMFILAYTFIRNTRVHGNCLNNKYKLRTFPSIFIFEADLGVKFEELELAVPNLEDIDE